MGQALIRTTKAYAMASIDCLPVVAGMLPIDLGGEGPAKKMGPVSFLKKKTVYLPLLYNELYILCRDESLN